MTTPFTLPSCTPPRAYTPSPCSCQRCKKDNQCPKLFSSDNMYPGSVPAELQGLSQTEEMLIARCYPIMRVIHLKGGQLGSDARPNQLQKKVLPALFHLRCPSQSHQRSARGRTRLTTVTSISCRSFKRQLLYLLLVLYTSSLVQRNEYSYCCCCRGKHMCPSRLARMLLYSCCHY